MKQSEADVQTAIIDALIWDGWMIIRINQGGRHSGNICPACYGQSAQLPAFICQKCGSTGKVAGRYVSFAYYQHLGIDQQDSGIADVLATKKVRYDVALVGEDVFGPCNLAIEVKAPGKKKKMLAALIDPLREDGAAFQRLDKREKNQARFLWSVQDHGGTAVVADCLKDVGPYLDRAEVQ